MSTERPKEKDLKKKRARTMYFDRDALKLWDTVFERVENIGKGKTSHVLHARERLTGESCALKCMRMDADFDVAVSREVSVMKRLNHEHVLKLFGVYKDDRARIVLQLEYCAYGTLHDMLKTGKNNGRSQMAYLGVGQIKAYALQIARGLAHMHRHGIAHRDLKTENILFSDSFTCKIGDFGLARNLDPKWDRYTHHVQTLWYRAPELCMGFVKYDVAVDVWSYGCLLAEMIFGNVLFPARPKTKASLKEENLAQLECVYGLCGTPLLEEWELVQRQIIRSTYDLPKKRILLTAFMQSRDRHARKSFISNGLVQLLDCILTLHPSQRPTMDSIVAGEYFCQEQPKPYAPFQMIQLKR